jgi:hypothetical protein
MPGQVSFPPGIEGLEKSIKGSGHALIPVGDVGQGAAIGYLRGEVQVGLLGAPSFTRQIPWRGAKCNSAIPETPLARVRMADPEMLEGIGLALEHAAVQMSAHMPLETQYRVCLCLGSI